MVYRDGGVIVAKMWWVDWDPQVVGGEVVEERCGVVVGA